MRNSSRRGQGLWAPRAQQHPSLSLGSLPSQEAAVLKGKALGFPTKDSFLIKHQKQSYPGPLCPQLQNGAAPTLSPKGSRSYQKK